MQRVALLPRTKLHDSLVADVGYEAFEDLAPQALARHLAATEENGGFHLVAFGEEAEDMVPLGFIVVVIHIDAKLYFLNRYLVLVLLGFALALFLLVQILAVVHDAAHRWLRGGRNFHQVQSFFASDLECLVGRHDAKLITFVVDHANFADADALIGADKTFVDTILRLRQLLREYSMGGYWKSVSNTLRTQLPAFPTNCHLRLPGLPPARAD